MRKEQGALFEMTDHGEEPSGGPGLSEYIPREAKCRKCGRIHADWHPKPPPTGRLYQSGETTLYGSAGLLVCHEALFDVLEPYWPEAKTTRCTSHPESPLKIGHNYVSVSVPRPYYTYMRWPAGGIWSCPRCGRLAVSSGYGKELAGLRPGENDPYVVLRKDQDEIGAFCAVSGALQLIVNPDIRRQVDALGISTLTWTTIAIFSEPLEKHRLPDDDPQPAPPPTHRLPASEDPDPA